MMEKFFMYIGNPAKELLMELLQVFIAPIKILFEIFIRYIEVEGWYVVIVFPFIMAFYIWLAYKLMRLVLKTARHFTGKPKNRSRRAAAYNRIKKDSSKNNSTEAITTEDHPWYSYDPGFEELYEKYVNDK